MDPKKVLVVAVLLSALAACDSSQPSFSASNAQQPAAQPPAGQAAQPGPAGQAPAPAAERAPPPATPPSNQVAAARAAEQRPNHMTQPVPAVESFGIAACDDYVARFRTCMNTVIGRGKIPNDQRFPLIRMVNGHVREWRAALAQDKTANLAPQCDQADKEARPLLHKAGCTSF